MDRIDALFWEEIIQDSKFIVPINIFYCEFFLSHVSVKQIAKIEKGQMNPSFLILKALAKVLPISLDSLINPDVSPEDEGAGQMKMLYCSCPSEMRETLLHHTQETMKELTELSEKFETNWAGEWI